MAKRRACEVLAEYSQSKSPYLKTASAVSITAKNSAVHLGCNDLGPIQSQKHSTAISNDMHWPVKILFFETAWIIWIKIGCFVSLHVNLWLSSNFNFKNGCSVS